MALEKELATYQRELPNLLKDAGKFALVHEDCVDSVWETRADAMQEGYRIFGLKPFMVKMIQAVEKPRFIARDIFGPCRS